MYKNKLPGGENNICGKNIKRLRQLLPEKTSQRKLADMLQIQGLDLDKNAIQRIESDKRFVTDIELKAFAQVFHMIRANVETEIAPIIGSEEQAQDLIGYIKTSRDQEEGIWQTNIFGKSIGELVEDGIRSKITMMDDESQVKLQDTMQKIVNDSNGGLVCIII